MPKRFVPTADAPESWRLSFHYDERELFGVERYKGYARAYARRRDNTLGLLYRHCPPPATVLDVAAGQGNFSLMMAEAGYSVTWNDLRADLADYVEKKRTKGDIRYRPGNVFEITHDREYDVVVATEVIEHVAHPDEFLRTLAGLVRTDGFIIMSTPNGRYFRNRLPRFSSYPDTAGFEQRQFKPDADGHIFLLHPDEVRSIARKAGLVTRELRLFTTPFAAGALRTEKLTEHVPEIGLRVIEAVTSRLPLGIQERVFMGMAAIFQKVEGHD